MMGKIILFDGECIFCNRNVHFIIKRDPQALFQFASLQSEIGKRLLSRYEVPTNENSLILLENKTYYSKSTAALKISKHLSHVWKLFYIFILIPKPFRDNVYEIIANNRYKWFKKDTCMIPSSEIKNRFL